MASAGTDLHITEGELPQRRVPLIPGHQIVGDIVAGATPELPLGTRVGVSWIGGTDGTCWYCRSGKENLCDSPTFTGYTVDGGYAEYATARADFVFPLPAALDDLHGRAAAVRGHHRLSQPAGGRSAAGERVGLFGFGASAHLAIEVLHAWKCEVYVSTRGESHQQTGAIDGSRLGRRRNREAACRT